MPAMGWLGLGDEEAAMARAIRLAVRVLWLVLPAAGWAGGASAGPTNGPSPADSLAVLRATVADLERRVEMLEACFADSSEHDEILRLAATDLEGLGGDDGWPEASPVSTAGWAGTGVAQPLLRFSGFGDLRYESGDARPEDGRERYGIGQAELDLDSNVSDAVSLDAAIWFDAERSHFELGAFAIDFRLWGGEEGHWRQTTWLDNSGIVIGQFDVPFGIDWQVNTSIDRRTVSMPLVVEETHGGWNDLGINGYAGTDRFNGTLFVLNGFDREVSDADLGTGPVALSSQYACGGRIGLAPIDGLEVGGSYAYLPSDDEGGAAGVTPRAMSLIGTDAQVARGSISLRGEYVAHHLEMDVEASAGAEVAAHTYARDNTGFYTTAMCDLGRYFVIARFDRFVPGRSEPIERLCGGGGWVVREQCEVRVEYQARWHNEPDVAYVQLAVGF